jgi:hypothetical protein
MDRIAIVLAMLTFMWPCIYGMEKTNPSQAVAPIPATSPAIQDKTTVSRGHEHGDSVRLSVTLSDLPSLTQQENLDKHGRQNDAKARALQSELNRQLYKQYLLLLKIQHLLQRPNNNRYRMKLLFK